MALERTENGPLAIGGVGGSGTRVVAEIAHRLGVFMGQRLNESWDNLDFPGLPRFRSPEPDPTDPVVTVAELDAFERTMVDAHRAQLDQTWGWKNPPNFLFLKAFAARFANLRYVHVIRHGLDMALSRNTRQVQQFGHVFGVEYARHESITI